MTAEAATSRALIGGYEHPTPAQTLVATAASRLAPDAEPTLEDCYEVCRLVNAAHGRTYFLAARLLPPERRRHVHALYGFARYADDLVDHADHAWSLERRREALRAWSEQTRLAIRRGRSAHPVLRALASTVAECGIAEADIEAFLRSMDMDLSVTRYATYDDLCGYMHGSAAVIGAMMVPVLGAPPEARERAMDLGVAFQLSNFLRDVGEDWDRGRIYLPLEDLDRFGVTEWDFRSRHVGPALRRLLAFEIDRTRRLYRRAEEGFAYLPPVSRRCIRVAHRLYGGILDRIERNDYQVFARRAAVPAARTITIAASEVLRSFSVRAERLA